MVIRRMTSLPPCPGFTITGRGTVSFKPRVKAEQVYLPINTPLTLRVANAWDGAADADLLAVMNQLLQSGFIMLIASVKTLFSQRVWP
jgi:hypothetical protein